MKTLVIGDIHGCYNELQQLLDLAGPTADDRIICIGDMVDRGPNPTEVVDFFINTPNATSLMGNREDKHVRAHDGQVEYIGARELTRLVMAEDDYERAIAYMRTLPLYLDLPDAILAHGYYEPSLPPDQQDRNVLLGHPEGEETLQSYDPWYEYYDQDKPLIIGHREYPFLCYDNRVWAIDTRCAYGGKLTGVMLPNFDVYTIPARADHWAAIRAQYEDILGPEA